MSYLTSKEDVEDAFDYNYHLKNVDEIFERVRIRVIKDLFV